MRIDPLKPHPVGSGPAKSAIRPPQKGRAAKAEQDRVELQSRAVKSQPKKNAVPGFPAPDLSPLPPKKWTVLLYAASNDGWSPHLKEKIWDIEDNMADLDNVNFLADRLAPPDYPLHDYRNKVIASFSCLDPYRSKEIAREDRIPVNSPEHLEKSLLLALKKYPAQNYLIVIDSHGSGFPGVIFDCKEKSFMPIKDFRQAVQNAEKAAGVDKGQVVLGFDTCLQGEAEALYEMKDLAEYIVASPSEIRFGGWNLGAVTGKENLGDLNPREMVEHIMDKNSEQLLVTETIAAYDPKMMPQLKAGMDELGKAILKDRPEKARLREALQSAQAYDNITTLPQKYVDLGDFCRKIRSNPGIKNPAVRDSAEKLQKILGKAVLREAHNPKTFPQSTGISAYPAYCPPESLPDNPSHSRYRDTAIGKETSWEKAMVMLLGQAEGKAR